MNPKLRTFLIGSAVALTLVGGLAVSPRDRGPGRDILGRLGARLDLTDTQREQIREIVDRHWEEGLGDAVRRARVARRATRGAIYDLTSDEAAIRAAARRVARAEEDLAVLRHAAFAEAFAVLTPEQQAKAKRMSERFRDRRL